MSDAVSRRVGSVEYRSVDSGYFKSRGLRRYAGLWSLWALGVGAAIAKIMQTISFVRLRNRFPTIERPYISPLGNVGAIAACAIACVTLLFLFINPDYRVGLYGCVILFAVGLVYFALISRKRLVRSPEEDFSLRQSHQLDD